jgi:hypothetical protein
VCNNRKEWDQAARLAAGRERYNRLRQFRALFRRTRVARLIGVPGNSFIDHGAQARIARELGVSRSTICRDMAYLLRSIRGCPHCGATPIPPSLRLDPGLPGGK